MKNSTKFWIILFILLAIVFPPIIVFYFLLYVIYSCCGYLMYCLYKEDEKEMEKWKFAIHNYIIKFNNFLNNL